MIYNYTRCESVIAKIMADLDSTEIRQRTTDIREWIFEAVDKIGAPMQYIKKESGVDEPILKIEDHQVPIPSDLKILDGVAYSTNPDGPWIPMNVSSSLFKKTNKTANHMHHVPEQPAGVKMITSQSQLYTKNTMKYIDRMIGEHVTEEPEYFIKPGWIVVNKPKGYIKLAYKAIAVDERGYPLIPDLSSYQEAVYWYVVMKLSFADYMKGRLGNNTSKYAPKYARDAYYLTQQNWNFYRNQAYAEAMMPTADDMRNIKNEWNRLIPEWDADSTFFKDINKEPKFYSDYYYGY